MAIPEEKLLIAIYSREVFEGNTIRQERPRCCGKLTDLYNTDVSFKDVELNGKIYTLIEPICPICKQRVKATFHIIH